MCSCTRSPADGSALWSTDTGGDAGENRRATKHGKAVPAQTRGGINAPSCDGELQRRLCIGQGEYRARRCSSLDLGEAAARARFVALSVHCLERESRIRRREYHSFVWLLHRVPGQSVICNVETDSLSLRISIIHYAILARGLARF